jgi:hypothetical protein
MLPACTQNSDVRRDAQATFSNSTSGYFLMQTSWTLKDATTAGWTAASFGKNSQWSLGGHKWRGQARIIGGGG